MDIYLTDGLIEEYEKDKKNKKRKKELIYEMKVPTMAEKFIKIFL